MLLCLWSRNFCSSGIFPAPFIICRFTFCCSCLTWSFPWTTLMFSPWLFRLASRVQRVVPFSYFLIFFSLAFAVVAFHPSISSEGPKSEAFRKPSEFMCSRATVEYENSVREGILSSLGSRTGGLGWLGSGEWGKRYFSPSEEASLGGWRRRRWGNVSCQIFLPESVWILQKLYAGLKKVLFTNTWLREGLRNTGEYRKRKVVHNPGAEVEPC